MITKLQLSNVATYKTLVEINDLKRVNFFFGNNGCGKSTIARLFYEFSKDEVLPDNLSSCLINNFNRAQEDILVFDQEFIQRNFYNNPELEGIFSLDEKNEIIDEKIKKEDNLIFNNDNTLLRKKEELESNKKQKQVLKEDILETCFDYNRSFGKDFNKINLGKKRETFLQKLIETKQNIVTPKDINYLSNRYKKLYVEELIKINNNISLNSFEEIVNLENKINELFNEIIVGSKDVDIAPLIDKLNNSSWIKQGIDSYLNIEKDNQPCPFCQMPTITQELLSQFNKYFDTTREEKLKKIKDTFTNYKTSLSLFNTQLQSISEQNIVTSSVLKLQKTIQEISFDNEKMYQIKLDKPNEIVQTKSINNLKTLIDEINSIISTHNLEVDNIEQSKSELTSEIWNYIASQVNIKLNKFDERDKEFDLKIDSIEKEITILNQEIAESRTKITDWQKQTVNTQKAVDQINDILIKNNFTGFKIEKKETENNIIKYFILRDTETSSDHVFKTLSEGEKNFIAFLYFYQLCLGTNDTENSTKKKVIIIDDPVSSMDSQVLFFVSTLIRKLIAKKGKGKDQSGNNLIEQLKNENIEQVFILTHNIFFYKEVALATGSRICNSTAYYNVKKSNGNSTIERVLQYKNVAFNDYHLLWQEIKKDSSEKISISLMNNMRRIIESYGNFMGLINEVDIWGLRNDIPEESTENLIITALISEMQEGSHRVTPNNEIYFTRISDEPKELALKSFELLFENIGGKTHYDKMMEIS
ncbi:AAA family ATPase [Elizabethkingia anophelis]|uniref:AAA family ATPase n=1 Tax=Elizabethkingia anophelis TaxID=1117645 RepID=UPI00389184FC